MAERFATCLICDDIRNEESNQTSVIGLYGTEIIVRHLPITLPQLCFLTSIFCPYDDPVKSLTVRVSYAGEVLNETIVDQSYLTEWATVEGAAGADEVDEFDGDETPKIRFSVHLTTSPFRLEREGRLSVHVETERETFRAGSLRVRQQAPKQMTELRK